MNAAARVVGSDDVAGRGDLLRGGRGREARGVERRAAEAELPAAVVVENSIRTRAQGGATMNAMMLAWKEGGWWMQPLGAVLVLTVYVIVERALWFQRSAFDAEEPFELLKERVRSRDLAGAITQCTLIRTPVVDGSPFPQRTDGRGRVAVAGDGGAGAEPTSLATTNRL